MSTLTEKITLFKNQQSTVQRYVYLIAYTSNYDHHLSTIPDQEYWAKNLKSGNSENQSKSTVLNLFIFFAPSEKPLNPQCKDIFGFVYHITKFHPKNLNLFDNQIIFLATQKRPFRPQCKEIFECLDRPATYSSLCEYIDDSWLGKKALSLP